MELRRRTSQIVTKSRRENLNLRAQAHTQSITGHGSILIACQSPELITVKSGLGIRQAGKPNGYQPSSLP